MSIAKGSSAPLAFTQVDSPARAEGGVRTEQAVVYRACVLTPSHMSDRWLRAEAGGALAFQSVMWLDAIYATLAPAAGAEPLIVEVTDSDGRLALILPLAVHRENGLRIATFADFGVSDYGAPVLGPAAPQDEINAEALWSAVRRGLKGVDAVRLTEMPERIGERINPLALVAARLTSRHASHSVRVDDTVEAMLKALGKKTRKEVERCFRLLEKEGEVSFMRAETADEIAQAYAVLEEQQRARHEGENTSYLLDRREYSEFYRRVIDGGSADGAAHIFTLSAGGDVAATLFGLTEGDAFTLLRIGNGGERWRHLSPGRLIVVEAMRYFVERGVRTFDMGIGNYAFKRSFDATERPLVDLIVARSWRALGLVALARLKSRARRSPAVMSLVARARALKRAG